MVHMGTVLLVRFYLSVTHVFFFKQVHFLANNTRYYTHAFLRKRGKHEKINGKTSFLRSNGAFFHFSQASGGTRGI